MNQSTEQLPLFPVGSRASRSVLPGSDEAQRMTDTSGRRCYGLFASYPRHTSWQKTFLDCFLSTMEPSSRLCVLTWKVQDTRYSRSIIRLQASVPRTNGTEYSLLPTATTIDTERLDNHVKSNLRDVVRMYPTPIAAESKRGDYQYDQGDKTKPRLTLQGIARMVATPDANCWKGGNRKAQLTDPKYGITPNGGQLNPTWVEWLMGFPAGWTDLSSSETQ